MSVNRRDLKTLVALIVLPFFGAIISGALLVQHGGGWQVASRGTSFLTRLCDPARGGSALCAAVTGSDLGEFDVYVGGRRLVFPTSYVGLAYFLTLTIWFGLIFRARNAARWLRAATWCAITGGLAVSLMLLAVMGLAIGEWCPLCVAAHLINGALFVIAAIWLLQTHPPSDRACDLPLDQSLRLRFALSSALLIATVVGGTWMYYDAMRETRRQWRKARGYADAVAVLQSDPALMLHAYYAQGVEEFAPDDACEPASDAAAATRVTLFVDYDSGGSACFEKRFNEQFKPLLPGAVQVSYRNFPVGESLHFSGGMEPSTGDLRAATAAEAARRLGGEAVFEPMRRLLFEGRHDPDARDVLDLADRVGLDVEAFKHEMNGDAVRSQVLADVAFAEKHGIRNAPAVFLNGRRVPDICLRSGAFWLAVGEDIRLARRSLGGLGGMEVAAAGDAGKDEID